MDSVKLKEQLVISSETDESCVVTAKSGTSKNTEAESPQIRKCKLSPDRESRPSKVAKCDIEEDALSAVSR